MLTITQEDMHYTTAKYLINEDRDIAGTCKVEFSDATVELPVRPVIMMLPYWEVYREMGYPVKSSHTFFTTGPYNEKLYNRIMKTIYDDCFDANQDSVYFDKLKTCLWNTINNVDDFGTFELLEYISGLDLISLAEIHQDPHIQEIVNADIREEMGPMRIKQKMIQGTNDLARVLTTEGMLKNEQLLSFMECEVLKVSQLYQMLGCYGLRTEINDRVFKYLVKGNSINGLRNFGDTVFENTSARKIVYYTYDAIKLSQYFNREMALACMPIGKLYKGDCGSIVLLPFVFKEEIIKNCYGKFFYLENDVRYSEEKVLTEHNAHEYVNRQVYMRSILTCRHTDGVCEHCMGLIARNHTSGINIGMTASSNSVSEISQLVLSTKHEDQAMPTVYVIPNTMGEYFEMTEEGISFKKSKYKDIKHMELGIFLEDLICSTGDLEYIRGDIDVPENKYSSIKTFMLKDTRTQELTEIVSKQSEIIPFLTTEFILYLKEKLKDGVNMDDQVFWIPLNDIPKKPIPIMRTIVYNNSMMVFVTKITNVFKKKYLSKYKDVSKALQDVAEIIFEKANKNINIFQLEILLRAHMVTSEYNYSIPIVHDTTDVIFKPTINVIGQRTISGQLAHESHNRHFANPMSYVLLKDQNPLDEYIGG